MAQDAAFQKLTAQAIKKALSSKVIGRNLKFFAETPSTNMVASTLAQEGAPEGTVVVADMQTAGRGRLGRQWFSPAGKNLYCSIILRTPTTVPQPLWLSWVPLIASAATAQTVQAAAGVPATVKWPNDILINHQKVGGILCESNGIGTINAYVVVGIGVNVNLFRDEFPEDIRDIATSMAIEANRPFDRIALLAALLSALELRHDAFKSGKQADIIKEYMLRCSTPGQYVQVELAKGQTVEGLADSIAPDGALRIVRQGPHGTAGTRTMLDIHAGDVTHLRTEDVKPETKSREEI